jgi:hypothetical protein
MLWRIVRSRGTIPLVLILAALCYWWLRSRPPQIIAVEHVGDRSVTIWNTLAQVRQPLGELHYGDRVEVVREVGTSAQVRTASGALGWLVDSRQMMDEVLWEQSASLLARARTLPVQAVGRTKTVSNVRIEPGRNGKRVFQLMRGTPVLVLERTVTDAPPSNDENLTEEKSGAETDRNPKQEAWLLVLCGAEIIPQNSIPLSTEHSAAPMPQASADPVTGSAREVSSGSLEEAGLPTPPIAGWVLARFIEPALPGPVRDYASSADLHVVAWFELNRVPDGSGGEAPQYLVAGARGGEGQPCDFTMLRVYTWGTARKRYETAYVESDLCGHLPIRVSHTGAGPEFHFAEVGENAGERTYIMRQTAVRRVENRSSEPHIAGDKSKRQ